MGCGTAGSLDDVAIGFPLLVAVITFFKNTTVGINRLGGKLRQDIWCNKIVKMCAVQ
jgi:hypothetical protein